MFLSSNKIGGRPQRQSLEKGKARAPWMSRTPLLEKPFSIALWHHEDPQDLSHFI